MISTRFNVVSCSGIIWARPKLMAAKIIRSQNNNFLPSLCIDMIANLKGCECFHPQPKYNKLSFQTGLEPTPEGICFRNFINCHDICGYSHGDIIFDRSFINMVKSVFHDPV